jgi:ribosomal protein S18 acetylase RimI-like enzyme
MINYSVYTATDADEMARLLAVAFAHRDPPSVAVGLTPAEFELFVNLYCPRAAAEGHTIVARSAETGEMAGALLTEDSSGAAPEGMERLSARFDPIFDLLGQLDAEYRAGRPPDPGECLHLYLLGVASRYEGQGIARQLVAKCLELGASKGYRVAVTEATNPTSQHVFRKQGFVERVRRSYEDHRFNGHASFASIAEHGGPMLMERLLVQTPAHQAGHWR